MSRTSRSLFKASAVALSLAIVGLFSAAVQAASINYGNFGPVGPGVTFEGVTESSTTDTVPIYGDPSAFAVGLDFNPTNFASNTSSGGADATVGQLNFTMKSPNAITSITLNEEGNYILFGAGSSATAVSGGAALSATVKAINGVPVAPIVLAPVNGSVGFDLASNPGVAIPWSIGLSLDVGALAPGATEVDVVVSNNLTSASETSSTAYIAKTEFIVGATVIPEPGTFALSGLALCGLGMAARRRG